MNRRRALGEKPKLWEASVFPADDDGWDSIVVRLLFRFSKNIYIAKPQINDPPLPTFV